MTTHIEAQALTTFEVTDDGARLKLNARDADGVAISLTFPAECLSQIVMTLPRMAQTALRRQHGDDSLRMVYPAATCLIERGVGGRDTFILTLTTPDGFEVSFGMDPDSLTSLEQSVRAAVTGPRAGLILN